MFKINIENNNKTTNRRIKYNYMILNNSINKKFNILSKIYENNSENKELTINIKKLKKKIIDPKNIIILILFNNKYGGSLTVNINKNKFYISNVYTLIKFRNKGFCKKIINFTINYLKKKNIKDSYIKLDVNINNPYALKCYTGLGFTIHKKKITKKYGSEYELIYKIY